jgi:Tol biopolymer transport system component
MLGRAAIVVCAAVATCGCGGGGSHAQQPPRAPGLAGASDGRLVLAFSQTGADQISNGFDELFVMRLDGGQLHRLTFSPWDETHPSWSPDGRRLAFVSDRGGTGEADDEIWVMRSDGTHQRRLTHNKLWDRTPAWSPTGKWIAFSRGAGARTQGDTVVAGCPGTFGWQIYLMRPNGTGTRVLGQGYGPAWSPDGRLIAYSRDGAIVISRADGTGVRAVTTGSRKGSAFDSDPSWSPDGRRLAFARGSGCGGLDDDIYVIDADGRNLRRLTHGVSLSRPRRHPENGTPSWSPDGRLIMFHSSRAADPLTDLWVMRPDGGRPRRVTFVEEPGGFDPAAWRPGR